MCNSSDDSPITLIVTECLETLSGPEQGGHWPPGPHRLFIICPSRQSGRCQELAACNSFRSMLTRPREGSRARARAGGEDRVNLGPFSRLPCCTEGAGNGCIPHSTRANEAGAQASMSPCDGD